MDILKIENCSFSYDKKHYAVSNVNLTVKKGEYVCILGHNGSGKSTLAKLITGLIEAKEGEIYIDNLLLNEENIDKIRPKVGIVFQNPDNQFVGVTVKDDIAFGLENRCIARCDMEKTILECARKVKMENFLSFNPEKLSGGEKQRVALAGALAYDADIIIFDEATSMIDPEGVKDVNEIILSLKGDKTIISITHNLEEALFADRIIVMNEGKVVLEGTKEEVFKKSDVLKNSNLDILDAMKILELVKKDDEIKEKKKLEDMLWQLIFQK